MFRARRAKYETWAILVAAGSASRMQGIDKQLCDIGGLPCIGRSMLAFQQCRDITGIVVVTRQDLFSPVQAIAADLGVDKLRHIVAGGKSRQQSVAAGVACLPESCQYIAVHDGARPLVRPDCITEVLADAVTYGAATAAVPVKDTIKVSDDSGFIAATPDRSTLYSCQTPQIFAAGPYRQALAGAADQGLDFTDDCQLLEHAGQKVYLSRGDYQNIKITTPEDIALAESFLD